MVASSRNGRLAMNDFDILTELELDVVSGGDKPIVVAPKVVEVVLGHESELQAALSAAANAIGTGLRP
jgi:hypothetical protein